MNFMARNVVFAFIVLSLPSLSLANELEVVTNVAGQDNHPSLHIKITNKSSDNVTLYRNSLPWVSRPGALFLKAFRMDPELSAIPVTGKVHDLVGTEDLLPNESTEGVIPLCSRIPNLDQEVARTPIVVLWVYSPMSPGEMRGGPYTGSFVLRAGTKCGTQ